MGFEAAREEVAELCQGEDAHECFDADFSCIGFVGLSCWQRETEDPGMVQAGLRKVLGLEVAATTSRSAFSPSLLGATSLLEAHSGCSGTGGLDWSRCFEQ